MTKTKWNYSGDMSLENGGLFWREDGADDYVRAVEVTPCSEAGGPSNLYYVEIGSIYLPNDDRRKLALASCCIEDEAKATRGELVQAMRGYFGIERDAMNGEQVIRIGKPEESGDGWNPSPDIILRSNASLENYVRNHFLD